MTDVAKLVSSARRMSSLTVKRAATLSGLAPSTVGRIERGELDPKFSTVERILAACGWRYDGNLQPNVDMDAVRAARRIFEPEMEIPATVGSDIYANLWDRAAIHGADDIAFAASRYASLSRRPGAKGFGLADWRAVARSLRGSTGVNWALTGGYAALGYTKIATVDWAVFYVDNVEEASELAMLPPPTDGRTWVTLMPFDDVTVSGVQIMADGLRLASFWQIVIDCYAGNGRMPAQAEAMVDKVPS